MWSSVSSHWMLWISSIPSVIDSEKRVRRAAPHRGLYAPNRIFFRNTAPKNHGRRQPCRGFFACLAKKSLVLECFAVLRGRFFATGAIAGRRNTGCISRQRLWLWRKRFSQNRVNPYVGPPKGGFLYYKKHHYLFFLPSIYSLFFTYRHFAPICVYVYNIQKYS